MGLPILFARKKKFNPRQLFAAGEQGVWYDPSDWTTLFQDSAGTTPVTAIEQPVGLMLDKSKGLVLGPELVTNGDFSNGTTGWTAAVGGIANVDNSLRVTGTNGRAVSAITTVVGKWYQVTALARMVTGTGAFIRISTLSDGGFAGQILTSSLAASLTFVPVSCYFMATTTTTYVAPIAFGTSGDSYFDNISVREILGNHASQPTTTSRPILRNLYNLLTYTEDFTGTTAWLAGGVNKTSATVVTATRTTNCTIFYVLSGLAVTATFVYQAKILKGKNFNIGVSGQTSGVAAIFNGTTGLYVGTTITGTRWVLESHSCITDPTDSNYWIASATVRCATADLNTYTVLSFNDNLSTTWNGGAATIGDTLTATQHSLVYANESHLPYQWVTTGGAAGYDTDVTKFKPYLFFDGSDDWLQTSNIDFSATDEMSVFAGVLTIAPTTFGVITELSASATSNNGSFAVFHGEGSATLFSTYVRGTGTNARSFTAPAAPPTYVYSSNITTAVPSGLSADAISIRLNTVSVGVNRASAVSSGNFGSAYPLYMGRRAGTTGTWQGRLYSLIIRGALTSSPQLEQTETWVAGKTGVTL